jgi:hypothetical protein
MERPLSSLRNRIGALRWNGIVLGAEAADEAGRFDDESP